jgi:ACDE family multidrug resistance protein
MSALSPLTIVLISDLLPPERELGGQGMKVVFDRIGMILLPVIGGALALVSWRLSIALFALTIPLALAAWLWMPETRSPGAPEGIGAYLRKTAAAIRRPRLHLAFATGFLRFFLDTGLYTYLPILLLLRYDGSPATVGWLVAVSAVGSIVTAMNAGRLRHLKAERMLALAFGASAVAIGLAAAVVPLWLLFVATFVFGLGNGIISPLQKSLLTQRTEPNLRGAVVSVDRVIQQVGKSIAPVLMGLLLLVGPIEWVFWSLCLASAAGTLLLAGRQQARRQHPG